MHTSEVSGMLQLSMMTAVILRLKLAHARTYTFLEFFLFFLSRTGIGEFHLLMPCAQRASDQAE